MLGQEIMKLSKEFNIDTIQQHKLMEKINEMMGKAVSQQKNADTQVQKLEIIKQLEKMI